MADVIKQTVVIEAQLTKIQSDLKTLEGNFKTSFGNIQKTANSALGTLGVGLSVAGLVAFGKNVVEQVGHLQDLSEQTGINAQTLSGLKTELENAGVSLDSFAKGILLAQKTLGGTDDEAKGAGAAIRALGLDLNDLQNSSPDQFLEKVSDALAKVGNEFERKAISAKIFGRAGAETANAIANLSGRLNDLRSTGLDAATIKSIDELGDSINKLKNSLVNFAAAPIANFFNFIRFLTGSLTEREQAVNQLDALAEKGLKLAAQIRAANDLRAQGSRTGIASDAVYNKLLEERDKILAQTTESTKKLSTAAATTEPFKNLLASTDDLKKVQNDVDNFLDGLQKQLGALQLKKIEIEAGPDAALSASLDAEFERLKEKLGTRVSAFPGLLEFFENLKGRILEANAELAKTVVPQVLKDLAAAKDIAIRKQVTLGVTFNADEAVATAIEQAIDKLASVTDPKIRKLALEAAVELKPQLDEAKIKSIQTQLGIALGTSAEFAGVLNRNFTNTFDTAAAKVQALQSALEQARQNGVDPLNESVQELAARLDQARIDQAMSNVARDLKIAANEAQVFGRSFDLGSANISIIERQLQDLIHQGLDPANAAVRELAAALQSAKVSDVYSDLSKDLRDAAAEAEVLGAAIDLPAARVDTLTDAIKRLIAEGLDPLDPRLQDLKKQLEEARAAERLSEAFQGIAGAISDSLIEISNDPSKWKQSITNLAKRINDELTRALVTKPLEDWIKSQANAIFGKLFPQIQLPGGQGQNGQAGIASQQFATSTNTFSLAVAQFAAAAGLSTAASGVPTPQTAADAAIEMGDRITGLDAQQPRITLPPWIVPTFPEQQSGQGDIFGLFKELAGQGIQSILSTADTAKMGIGEGAGVAKAGLDVLLQSALAALQSVSATSSASNAASSGGGFLGMLSGLFGGGEDVFAGGATGYEAGFFHKGGPIGAFPKYHAGGGLKPNERMVVAEEGEFIVRKEAVRRHGLKKLEKLNRVDGAMPATFHRGGPITRAPILHDGGAIETRWQSMALPKWDAMAAGNQAAAQKVSSSVTANRNTVHNSFNFHGVDNAESFRRSRVQILSDLTRAVAKGQKNI